MASLSKTYPLLITSPILFFVVVFPFSVGWVSSSTDFPLLQAFTPGSLFINCDSPSLPTTHYSFRTSLPLELLRGKRCRLPSPSPNGPKRTAVGDCSFPYLLWTSTFIISLVVSLTLHFHFLFTPVSCLSYAPRSLHTFFIYFIEGCAPHSIIMFNHDDSIPFPTLIHYKYSRCSRL